MATFIVLNIVAARRSMAIYIVLNIVNYAAYIVFNIVAACLFFCFGRLTLIAKGILVFPHDVSHLSRWKRVV